MTQTRSDLHERRLPAGGRAKKWKFFVISYKSNSRAAGRELVNGEEVFRGGPPIFAAPSLKRRGFREYPVKPTFRISTRLGRRLHDVERTEDFWLVSGRAKRAFESVAASDFAFLPVDAEVDANHDQKEYWLCDVLPVIDAVDEERSKVKIGHDDAGSRFHDVLVLGGATLHLDESVVRDHHVFRLETNVLVMMCDETFKEAYKEAGLTGLSFRDPLKLL